MTFKKNPSPWSKVSFFGMRALQFIFATFVIGIAGYFNYNLDADGYPIPWEFITVEAISGLTYLNIIVTTILLFINKLSPLVMMVSDGLLALMWVLSFSMLSRAMGRTTAQACDIANWGSKAGITICHLYKCLFAFVLLGWVMHLISTVFASSVRQKVNKHSYELTENPGNLDANKQGSYNPGAEPIRDVDTSYSAPKYNAGKGDLDLNA